MWNIKYNQTDCSPFENEPKTAVFKFPEEVIEYLEENNYMQDKRGNGWVIPSWFLERIGDSNLFRVHQDMSLMPKNVKKFALEALEYLKRDKNEENG